MVWGTGRDQVDLRIGLSYYAPEGDRIVWETTVHGEPAIVFDTVPSDGQLGVSWVEGACQYTVFLSPEFDAAQIADYMSRY